MQAYSNARAPKPVDDVIPAGSQVFVSYQYGDLDANDRLELNHLIDLIAVEHLHLPLGTVGNEGRFDWAFGTEAILSYPVDFTVGIAPFERALAAIEGHGIIGFLFGTPRVATAAETVAVSA